jgi:hypothetical protein
LPSIFGPLAFHLNHDVQGIYLSSLESELRCAGPLFVPLVLGRLKLFLKPINVLRQDADNGEDVIPGVRDVVSIDIIPGVRRTDRGLVRDALDRDTNTSPAIVPCPTWPFLTGDKASGTVWGDSKSGA